MNLSFITPDEINQLRAMIKGDLEQYLPKIKEIAKTIALVIAPWLPAVVLVITLQFTQETQLKQYLSKGLGSTSAFLDSMFVNHQLCKEYLQSTEKERIKSRFYERFDNYMFEYIKRRANLAEHTSVARTYFGNKTAYEISALMELEAYYGNTPREYCSHNLLSWEGMIKIERKILDTATKAEPLLTPPESQ